MTVDEATAVLPIRMILSVAFGFFVGELCGDYSRHRKYLEQVNAELRERLQQSATCQEPLHDEIKHQRSVLHDIHRRLLAVTKGLEKYPS